MKYDPVKKVFGNIVARNVLLRRVFYFLLDMMFLRAWHVKKMVRDYYKGSEKLDIFDAGMGFGQYTYFMAKYFPNSVIDAVDVKDEQVEDCRYFFGKTGLDKVKFDVADLTTINYRDKYDFILCVDVMEHIYEDELVFNNFAKALKQGGKLLVNTPSNLGGSDVHEEGEASFIEEHARDGYGKEEIIDKIERAGLKVTDFRYTYGKYGTIAWRWGIKYPILMAGASKLLILVLPFYYLFTLIPVLILMRMDLNDKNEQGTGIVLMAEKVS